MIFGKEPHKHIFYELKDVSPPTVFVDNNPGYIVYSPTPIGYKNFDLNYSNIKGVAGFNIYCSDESIGVCLFKNNLLFSTIDMAMAEFFTVSLPPQTSVSLIGAYRVTMDHVVIAAIANVDPAVDDVLYASKSFNLHGAMISSITQITPNSISTKEKDEHERIFNEDRTYTSETTDEFEFITYEGYNGSTGFGDVTIEEFGFASNRDESLKLLTERAIMDCESYEPRLSFFRDKEIYAFESMRHNEYIIFVGISATSMFYMILGEEEAFSSSISFEEPLNQSKFDNVHYQPIMFVPKFKKGKALDFISTLAPMGVFREYKEIRGVVVTRIETGEDKPTKVAEYFFEPKILEDESMELQGKMTEDEQLVPTTSIETDVSADEARYASGLSMKAMNHRAVAESDNLGRNLSIEHKFSPENNFPGQEEESNVLKSMADIVAYY